jgi:TRAP-type C4-dicarboxylate transport system substrate-binding protein
VDGQDNPVTDTVQAGFADIQRHFAAIDYVHSGMGLWCSAPAWGRLGPQRQAALRAACAEAAAATEAALEAEVRDAYAALAAKGVAVTRPDPEPFRAALATWVAESDGQRWPAGLHARIAAL